jgi:hypothetical protein
MRVAGRDGDRGGRHRCGDAVAVLPTLLAALADRNRDLILRAAASFDVVTTGRIDRSGAHHSAPADQEVGSLTYLLYGLTDRLTLGMIPRFFYQDPAGAPNSSGVGVGDLTLQAGYGLTRYQEGSYVPALAFVVDETLPTGRYDRLERASDEWVRGLCHRVIDLFAGLFLDAQRPDPARAPISPTPFRPQ